MEDIMLKAGDISKLLRCSTSQARIVMDRIGTERLTEGGHRRVWRSDVEKYAQQRNIRVDWSVLEERAGQQEAEEQIA